MPAVDVCGRRTVCGVYASCVTCAFALIRAPSAREHNLGVKTDAADVIHKFAALAATPAPDFGHLDMDVVASAAGENKVNVVLRESEFAGQHVDNLEGLFLDAPKHLIVGGADNVVGVEVEDEFGAQPALLLHGSRRRKRIVCR